MDSLGEMVHGFDREVRIVRVAEEYVEAVRSRDVPIDIHGFLVGSAERQEIADVFAVVEMRGKQDECRYCHRQGCPEQYRVP